MSYLVVLSLFLVIAAWNRLGALSGVMAAVILLGVWILGLRAYVAVEKQRDRWELEEERRIEDEAGRRWAREELLTR